MREPDFLRPRWLPAAAAVDRRLPPALVVICAVLAAMSAVDGDLLEAAAWLAGAAFWRWRSKRAGTPPAPLPPTVDEEWARRVLVAAGQPRGVPAVKALRDAEPALSLLHAKQLADRVTD